MLNVKQKLPEQNPQNEPKNPSNSDTTLHFRNLNFDLLTGGRGVSENDRA